MQERIQQTQPSSHDTGTGLALRVCLRRRALQESLRKKFLLCPPGAVTRWARAVSGDSAVFLSCLFEEVSSEQERSENQKTIQHMLVSSSQPSDRLQ